MATPSTLAVMSESPASRIDSAAVTAAADRLRAAAMQCRPTPPVRDLIGSDDIVAAYAVQRRLADERVAAGATIVGRKIGLTSEAVQKQLGVDRPDFGLLFDDMAYDGGDTVPYSAVLQPRIEAEIAFVLKEDLAGGPLDAAQVRSAIDYATPALEICGSRIQDWDITFGDTVADNASAGAFVLGPVRRNLDQVEPKSVGMQMAINENVVSTGNGAACLGDPITAVVWLARQAREFGEPLRGGQVILSGALGPMRPVRPGDSVTATITGLGKVSVTFGYEGRVRGNQ
ncbi:2-keto-4-pentenoate hydratase [Dactylosporangium sp. NPDC000521]|uniref:2-keto-4-pentenoate hydratase n=1 Tax=Dactylosporangium sp. NPDC000521 TaxID=3363975 RepID=UPI00368AF35B